MTDAPEHITTTEARGGTTPRMTRYVLGWGLFLVVVAFVLIYFLAR
ncbi:MAG TPA: hypothetical protein VF693_01730 [Allosphingosinicella sp.]|jgi:hypothetical protein